MSFTFDSLKQAIQDYTENTETTFVSNLPVNNVDKTCIYSISVEIKVASTRLRPNRYQHLNY